MRLMRASELEFPGTNTFRLFTGEKSDRNIALYEGLGYRIYERQDIPNSFAIVFMEKLISPL